MILRVNVDNYVCVRRLSRRRWWQICRLGDLWKDPTITPSPWCISAECCLPFTCIYGHTLVNLMSGVNAKLNLTSNMSTTGHAMDSVCLYFILKSRNNSEVDVTFITTSLISCRLMVSWDLSIHLHKIVICNKTELGFVSKSSIDK